VPTFSAGVGRAGRRAAAPQVVPELRSAATIMLDNLTSGLEIAHSRQGIHPPSDGRIDVSSVPFNARIREDHDIYRSGETRRPGLLLVTWPAEDFFGASRRLCAMSARNGRRDHASGSTDANNSHFAAPD